MRIRNEDRDEWAGVAGSGGRGEEHRLAADKGIPSACVCGGQCAIDVSRSSASGAEPSIGRELHRCVTRQRKEKREVDMN